MAVQSWAKDENSDKLTVHKGAVVNPSQGKELYRIQNGQRIAYFQKTKLLPSLQKNNKSVKG